MTSSKPECCEKCEQKDSFGKDDVFVEIRCANDSCPCHSQQPKWRHPQAPNPELVQKVEKALDEVFSGNHGWVDTLYPNSSPARVSETIEESTARNREWFDKGFEQGKEEGLREVREWMEARFKGIPASVQCRVAIDCKWCQGRIDVSYHDALADLHQFLDRLSHQRENDKV